MSPLSSDVEEINTCVLFLNFLLQMKIYACPKIWSESETMLYWPKTVGLGMKCCTRSQCICASSIGQNHWSGSEKFQWEWNPASCISLIISEQFTTCLWISFHWYNITRYHSNIWFHIQCLAQRQYNLCQWPIKERNIFSASRIPLR